MVVSCMHTSWSTEYLESASVTYIHSITCRATGIRSTYIYYILTSSGCLMIWYVTIPWYLLWSHGGSMIMVGLETLPLYAPSI